MSLILIVDDEDDIQTLLNFLLTSNGYETVTAENGQQALDIVSNISPDLIILDIMMPIMDGIEACKRLRQVTNVPILMLTAKTGEADLVQSLNIGADDFVNKPSEPRVLLAKIKALLRRADSTSDIDHIYQDPYLTIELRQERVLVQDEEVKLTATEFKLLSYLFRNAERVVTHEELIRDIWGDAETSATKRSLKLYMFYLRRKIEQHPDAPVYLKTAWGIGYRFHRLDQAS